MPTVTDTAIIEDDTLSFPKDNGDIDQTLDFTASGVNAGAPVVLAFRMNPNDPVTLNLKLNDEEVLTLNFDDGPVRSLHELVRAGVLVDGDNELTVTMEDGSGDISDLYVMYQRTI